MSDVAPRVFISYAHDSEQHKEHVRRFGEFLHTKIGLDVELDQWDDAHRRDWSTWATEHLTASDFVIVVASPDYKARAEATAPPHEGRGSQFEAAIIRDNLTRNLQAETRRFLPVVLHGHTEDEIPNFLHPYSTTRYHVDEFSEAGVAELITAITGRARHPRPKRGVWRGGAVDKDGEEKPYVLVANGLPWRDHSADVHADAARIEGLHYGNSIVVRSASSASGGDGYVEVDLDRGYRRFTAVAGVLDDAAENFQVGTFRVRLDGELRAETTVCWGAPATVEVDVTGARLLRLEMHRQGGGRSPMAPGKRARAPRAGRAPELAWGDPTLSW